MSSKQPVYTRLLFVIPRDLQKLTASFPLSVFNQLFNFLALFDKTDFAAEEIEKVRFFFLEPIN